MGCCGVKNTVIIWVNENKNVKKNIKKEKNDSKKADNK